MVRLSFLLCSRWWNKLHLNNTFRNNSGDFVFNPSTWGCIINRGTYSGPRADSWKHKTQNCFVSETRKGGMSFDTGEERKDMALPEGRQITGFNPPESVKGMMTLDREAFEKVVEIPALRCPVRRTTPVKVILKKLLVKTPKIPSRPCEGDPDHRYLFLAREKLTDSSGTLPDEIREKLWKECQVDGSLSELDVTLSYEQWTSYDILRAILPDHIEVLSSFSRMGHLIHVNLRENQLPYKYIIGQVLLDKNPGVKTVVNKVDNIENRFRFFRLEVLAGDGDTVTTVKENGLTYELDFAKVYWNSRLGTEHQRLVDTFSAGDVLYDVFAGIGPFSVPAAKKGCRVLANDLNPDSYRWLTRNITKNKVADRATTFNQDARHFIEVTMKADLTAGRSTESEERVVGTFHVAMNLPGAATDFLDTFAGLLTDLPKTSPPYEVRVHCYLFSVSDEPERDTRERIRDKLQPGMDDETIDVHRVRNVAPNKEMMCASFRLNEKVLRAPRFDKPEDDNRDVSMPCHKKPRLD